MDGVIQVTGVGSAAAPPDLMRIELAAEHEAGAAHEALDGAASALESMRAALFADGVAQADLATEGIDLDTRYGERGQVAGYRAALGMSVLLRDLGRAGAVLAHAVEQGGDAARVRRMSLAHRDPQALAEQAQQAAWQDAVAKAERYARLAGGTLGEASLIEELDGRRPPEPRLGRAVTFAAAAVPVDPGSAAVHVSLSVTFRLR